MMFYKVFAKIIIDIVIAVILFCVFFPLFFLLALVLTVSFYENPFFVQTRPGRNGRLFKIIKFKTMTSARDATGKLLPDNDRMTVIGSFIRKSSLDEIPQLLNVIKGDMSLVGPRPLLPEYLSLYSKEQMRRHEVRPGITGWAQVNGRNAINWEQKFELDIYYVDNLNFWLDLRIIFLTIKKICVREGISSATSVSMEKFTGN